MKSSFLALTVISLTLFAPGARAGDDLPLAQANSIYNDYLHAAEENLSTLERQQTFYGGYEKNLAAARKRVADAEAEAARNARMGSRPEQTKEIYEKYVREIKESVANLERQQSWYGGHEKELAAAEKRLAGAEADKSSRIAMAHPKAGEFQQRFELAERDFRAYDKSVHEAKMNVTDLERRQSLYGDREKELAEAKKQLARAEAERNARFGQDIEKLRGRLLDAEIMVKRIEFHFPANPDGLLMARHEYQEAAEEFVSRWKGKLFVPLKGKAGKMGIVGAAAVLAPIAAEAVMGNSSAEAHSLEQADLKPAEAEDAERTPVEISATLDDN